jgi:hypothetical protein
VHNLGEAAQDSAQAVHVETFRSGGFLYALPPQLIGLMRDGRKEERNERKEGGREREEGRERERERGERE